MQATTLSIHKTIHHKAARRARLQHLSVSAVARMLLEAYGNGTINIMAVAAEEPVQLFEVADHDISPEMRNAASRAYRMKREDLINL